MFDARQYRLFNRFRSGIRFEPRSGILASNCFRLPVVRTLITRCPAPFHPENMATYRDAIYIDESGNGSPTNDILRCWVSVAIAVPLHQTKTLDRGVQEILTNRFRPYIEELKGASMSRYLLPSSSVIQVASDLGGLLDAIGAHTWAVASSYGRRPPKGSSIRNPRTKDIVRHLLLERINGLLVSDYHRPDHFLIIWDISNQRGLQDFSTAIARFHNSCDGVPRSDRLAHAALGGISHNWSGLQAADLVAHCALHHLGRTLSLPGSNPEKAEAFERHLMPRLERNSTGSLVGWMVW